MKNFLITPLSISSVSEKAMLSYEAGRHFMLNFTIKNMGNTQLW